MPDIGFYNFLIPLSETQEEAVRAVARRVTRRKRIRVYLRSHRANMFGTAPITLRSRTKTSTIIVQIESQLRRYNVDAIAAAPSAMAILSAQRSSRRAGSSRVPLHLDAADDLTYFAMPKRKHGKPCGILAPVEADARCCLARNSATLVAAGSDLGGIPRQHEACRHL